MSELRDGLMLGLQSLGNQLVEEEMLSWSNSNRWVANGFVWGEGEELNRSKNIKNRNLAAKKEDDGFALQKTEKAKKEFDYALEADSLAQVTRDDERKENRDSGTLPPIRKTASIESKESLVLEQASSTDQSGALDALERQRTNSKALYSQINTPMAKQQAPASQKAESQLENYREAQSFLSQNIADLISNILITLYGTENHKIALEGFSYGSKGNSFIDIVQYNTFLRNEIVNFVFSSIPFEVRR